MNKFWMKLSPVQRVIAFLIAFALVFSATVLVVSKAEASVSQGQKICQPGGNPDLNCLTNTQLVHKFKKGKLGRSHGFKPAAHFKNPKQFKKMAHNQMVVYLRHHPRVEGILRHKFLTKRDPGCSDYCLAWKTYGELVAASNCDYPAGAVVDPRTCNQPNTTCCQKAIVKGVTVAYCSGALVLGAVGAFSTEGRAAPQIATIYGGIGCGWGFVSSFFN